MASSVNPFILLCISFLYLLFRRNRRRSCRVSPIEQITYEMDQLQLQPPPPPPPPTIFHHKKWNLILVKEDEERIEFKVEWLGEEETYTDASDLKFKDKKTKVVHKDWASAKKSRKLMKKLDMEPLVIITKEYIEFVFNEDEEVDGSRFDPESGHPVGYGTNGSLLGQGYKGLGKF